MSLDYFNLNSRAGRALEDTFEMSWFKQLVLYIVILVGVLSSDLIIGHAVTSSWSLSIDIPKLIFSMGAALLTVPHAYEKLKANPKAPYLIHVALFYETGIAYRTFAGLA
jgi:hypothetical protein